MMIRRLICAACVLGCAVLIGFHGGAASYLLFWTALLIPLYSYIYRRMIADQLKIYVRLQNRTVIRGGRTVCTLILNNNSPLPMSDIRIFLTDGKVRFIDTPLELRCSLRPEESKTLEFEVECLHCGQGAVGVQAALVQDIFALSEQHFEKTETVQVLPRTQHIQDLIIAPVRQAERQKTERSYYGNTMPDGQLKPYTPGEDVRRIHWKASVLQGKPILRNLIPEPKNEIVLLPDARAELPSGAARWLVEDSMIEGTLAICDYFLRHHIPVRVLPDAERGMQVHTAAHYLTLYAMCASGFFTGSARPEAMLEQDVTSRNGQRSYIMLTWALDEHTIRRISNCIEVGAEVTMVYIGDDSEAKILAAAQPRMAFYQVTSQKDIFAILGGTGTGEGDAG